MFYLLKLKVAFKNAIFWCEIWAVIYANHFHNLELNEFKTYSPPACTSMTFSNLEWFFQKNKNNLKPWKKLFSQIENLFFSEKIPPPWNRCCSQRLTLLTKSVGKIKQWYRGIGEKLRNWKPESLLEFTGFSTFVLTSFVQGCGKFLKHKR